MIEQFVTFYDDVAPHYGLIPSSDDLPANYGQWQRYQAPGRRYRMPIHPEWRVEPLADARALSAFVIHLPQWPNLPIEIHEWAGARNIAGSQSSDGGGMFALTSLREFLGLPANDQDLQGEVLLGGIDANTRTCTVVLVQGDTTYELTASYQVGLHADRAQLGVFMALVAGFEVDQ